MEKIKRDKNRVDIAKLKEDDISGENLTGVAMNDGESSLEMGDGNEIPFEKVVSVKDTPTVN